MVSMEMEMKAVGKEVTAGVKRREEEKREENDVSIYPPAWCYT
jgi:hypothetical protein